MASGLKPTANEFLTRELPKKRTVNSIILNRQSIGAARRAMAPSRINPGSLDSRDSPAECKNLLQMLFENTLRMLFEDVLKGRYAPMYLPVLPFRA
jgi:hypothetical protein